MSSIQHGIQSAHCIVDMMRFYELGVPYDVLVGVKQYDMLSDWADNHKTMMVMGGGNAANLQELYDFFNNEDNSFPYGLFREDEQSLNNTLTCVGICLPEIIYESARQLRCNEAHWINYSADVAMPNYSLHVHPTKDNEGPNPVSFTVFDHDLVERLNTYGLAR